MFSDFADVSKETWKAKAIEDLKGGDFEKKLVWKTDDGFSIQPFYTIEDIESSPSLKNQYKAHNAGSTSWISYVEIETSDAKPANELALEMKSFGAEGFLFRLQSAIPDFETLLKGIDPATDHIAFSTPQPSVSLVEAYITFLKNKGIAPEKVNGFYESDILESLCLQGTEPNFNALADVLKLTKAYPNFKGLSIRSHAFVNAGAATTQELAFTLSKITDIVEKLSAQGLEAKEIINEFIAHLAISGDYFFEIAKLRALRILLKNILTLYSCEEINIPVLSSNAAWSKSFYDPNVNMLRNTTEAMSAVLGGCDALMVNPHDITFREPTKFSKRVALNISNLLKAESYLDKVADPSAGSYYLENLTASVCEQALNLFKQTEEKGGFVTAFKNGIIQNEIAAVKNLKEKEIISRKRVYVGSNKFPDLKERTAMPPVDGAKAAQAFPHLQPQHATKAFEELKSRTMAHLEKTGFVPKVYLACFGDLAMRKARATFAGEFFGTAGFEIMDDNFFESAEKAAETAANSEANIIVMCSSDAEYETEALKFAEKFKSINKNKLLVLAGYPETIMEQLKAAGVEAFVHLRSNAITELAVFQQKLGIGS